jgi:hypothetical protein
MNTSGDTKSCFKSTLAWKPAFRATYIDSKNAQCFHCSNRVPQAALACVQKFDLLLSGIK